MKVLRRVSITAHTKNTGISIFQMADKISDKKCNVLVGCSGSVASIKIPEIVDRLIQLKVGHISNDNILKHVNLVNISAVYPRPMMFRTLRMYVM